MKLVRPRWGWLLARGLVLLSLSVACSHGKVPPGAAPEHTFAYHHAQHGIASWYGVPFHGRRTANGEVYDMYQLTAAHRTAPLGIQAIVTNLDNGRAVHVRINDRGPFIGSRILDLSYAAAQKLGMVEVGLAPVSVQFLPNTVPVPLFVVQAGAFSNPDNAVRVQQQLAPHYPRVQIVQRHDGPDTLHRVWLGKFASRGRAEQIATQVQDLGFSVQILPLPQPEEASTQSANQL